MNVGTGTTRANSRGSPSIVVGHGDDGVVAVAGQHHLRGLVEEFGVGLGDVEAAEGLRRGCGERDDGGGR